MTEPDITQLNEVVREQSLRVQAAAAEIRKVIVGQPALVDRQSDMRIRLDPAMAGEMLAAGDHAGAVQALNQRACQFDDRGRIRVKRTITDDAAAAPIKVEYRRKRQVDATRA